MQDLARTQRASVQRWQAGQQQAGGSTSAGELELAAAVATVRDELLKAARSAADEGTRFEVGDVTMEFSVEMRKDARCYSRGMAARSRVAR